MRPQIRLLFLLLALAPALRAQDSTPAIQKKSSRSVDALVPWLLTNDGQFQGIPLSEVILAATGKRVLPVDQKSEIDRRVREQFSRVLDEADECAGKPIAKCGTNQRGEQSCGGSAARAAERGPRTKLRFSAEGHVQRSSYPDLRIVDLASGRVFYLDPKLYATGSRASSFRTFYFEPKVATNKVRDDAVHLLVGFEHQSRTNGRWNFTRWDVVDLSYFKVRLKAEFQASNRDIYRPDAIVATSAPPK